MPGDKKLPVTIAKVEVGKLFDNKLAKPASEKLAAEVEAAIGKSGKLEVARSVDKKDKGFHVTVKIVDITMDDKKDELACNIEIILHSLPGPKMIARVTGSAKFQGVNPKKMDKEVADLMAEAMKKTGSNVKKGLEDKIDAL